MSERYRATRGGRTRARRPLREGEAGLRGLRHLRGEDGRHPPCSRAETDSGAPEHRRAISGIGDGAPASTGATPDSAKWIRSGCVHRLDALRIAPANSGLTRRAAAAALQPDRGRLRRASCSPPSPPRSRPTATCPTNPTAAAIARALMVAVPIAVGLYAWHRRPDERFGPLLVAAGFGWFLTTLAESGDSLVYSIGRVSGWVVEIGLVWLILSFPSGRLTDRVDRMLVQATAALVVVALPADRPAGGRLRRRPLRTRAAPRIAPTTRSSSSAPSPAIVDALFMPGPRAAHARDLPRGHVRASPARDRREPAHAPHAERRCCSWPVLRVLLVAVGVGARWVNPRVDLRGGEQPGHRARASGDGRGVLRRAVPAPALRGGRAAEAGRANHREEARRTRCEPPSRMRCRIPRCRSSTGSNGQRNRWVDADGTRRRSPGAGLGRSL